MSSPAARDDNGNQDVPVAWQEIEESSDFRELISARRKFVVPAAIFFFVVYFGFILLSGYAPDLMRTYIYRGLTIGYVYMLGPFVMVWTLVYLYLRRAVG